jgi:hypothetical protein
MNSLQSNRITRNNKYKEKNSLKTMKPSSAIADRSTGGSQLKKKPAGVT